MDNLIDGYRRFRELQWPEHKTLFERLAARGQKPETFVVACSDSRVDPQMIFNAGPGELFVARNVANLVPPYQPDGNYHGTSAALEFAVRVLQVKRIVVMGHAQCGGVQAMLQGTPPEAGDFVAQWITIADEARKETLNADVPEAERQRHCEHSCVRLSVRNLMTFPWIAERVREGSLSLHGAYFGVATGRLEVMGGDGTFRDA